MRVRDSLFKLLTFLVCSSLPAWSGALALSDVELRSYLNQPLDARIGLLAVAEGDLASLNVTISGSTEDSGNQRFQYLRHEVLEDERGHYIKVTSPEVVKEPILSFKVEINWSKGQLIREYSLLIDPQ